MEKKSFGGIKCTVVHYILLVYLYYNKHFDIHTDASNYQLGAVIIHDGKPIAFCNCKLTEMQDQVEGGAGTGASGR